MTEEKSKHKWQNLLFKKCPKCGTPFEEHRQYFICPNPHPTEKGKNCFFIKKEIAAQFLLDPNHAANRCLHARDREIIEETIKNF